MNTDYLRLTFGNVLQIATIIVSVMVAYSALKSDIGIINTKLHYIERDISTIQKAFGILDKQQ